jgi:hypothetical protein
MAKPPVEAAPPVAFPFWPLSCMEFYLHAMRDFGRYNQAVTQSTDPMQTLRAEGDYGLSLWQDAMQAWFDLAVLPMTLAAKAAAATPVAPPNQADLTAAE